MFYLMTCRLKIYYYYYYHHHHHPTAAILFVCLVVPFCVFVLFMCCVCSFVLAL